MYKTNEPTPEEFIFLKLGMWFKKIKISLLKTKLRLVIKNIEF